MTQKVSRFESIMELIKTVVVCPRSPSSPSSPKLYQSIDYSLILQGGPLSESIARKKLLYDFKEDRFSQEETDSGISSLSSPTPDLEGKYPIEEFDMLGDETLYEFATTTELPINESPGANSYTPKSLLIPSPFEELVQLKQSLSGEKLTRSNHSSSPLSIMDLHDSLESKKDNFFQANFERRYFPVLRDILGGQSAAEEPPQSTESLANWENLRQQSPSSPHFVPILSPSSDYESSDVEEKSVPSLPSTLLPVTFDEEEVDEGVEDMATRSAFMREFLREPVSVDPEGKEDEIGTILEHSLVEDLVVCSALTPPSPAERSCSTPIPSSSHQPKENAEPTLYLFEINVDALPRPPSPSTGKEELEKDDSPSRKKRPDVSSSSNSACENPVEILIASANLSFDLENDDTIAASCSESPCLTEETSTRLNAAASPSTCPRILLATSCDLTPITAELEITFLSTSKDDDDQDSDFDDEEEDDDDEVDKDDQEVDGAANKGDEEGKEGESINCSISVLDILNGSGSIRQRRISEQSFDSVDWSESDNDDSQITFANDDRSCFDQDLLTLWESFQPHVVTFAHKSPSQASQPSIEFERSEGEGELELSEKGEIEEVEEGVKEEDEEQDEVYEEAEDIPDQEEGAVSQDTTTRKKAVSFAPLKDLVQVHLLNDDEDGDDEVSRKGPWEEMARDRCRFRRRIIETQVALGGIFSHFHRGVMFQSIHASGTCLCHPDDGDSESSDYEDCSDGRI